MLVAHGLQPLIASVLTRHFDGEVAKPRVGLGAMPVLLACRDDNDRAGFEAYGFLSFGLVPAAAGSAQQNLPAALRGVVDVPVVPASWLERHVANRDAFRGEHVQVALAEEILAERGVRVPARENRVEI